MDILRSKRASLATTNVVSLVFLKGKLDLMSLPKGPAWVERMRGTEEVDEHWGLARGLFWRLVFDAITVSVGRCPKILVFSKCDEFEI